MPRKMTRRTAGPKVGRAVSRRGGNSNSSGSLSVRRRPSTKKVGRPRRAQTRGVGY